MERLDDGRQDTWAGWKATVSSLTDDQKLRYLRDVEGFAPERIARFNDFEAAVGPDDWASSDDAQRATDRVLTFRRAELEGGDHSGGALDFEEAREAAEPPAAPPPAGEEPAPSIAARPAPAPRDVASGYGGSALDEESLEERVLGDQP